MKYVSDIIEEKYKEWKPGQSIFISTPTGSGKTTFVLNELVEYAALTNKKILYLVNRKILKEQLDVAYRNIKRILHIKYGIGDYDPMTIETYQKVEASFGKSYEHEVYNYIIADECHYFLMDSMFNTNTHISLEWVMSSRFDSSVRVFMSATIESIKDYIMKYYLKKEIPIYERDTKDLSELLEDKQCLKKYVCEKNTDNISIHIFDKIESLFADIEVNKRSRWLIFVDNKQYGESLIKKMVARGIDAIFIDAEYQDNIEKTETVKGLTKNLRYTQKVLIATSVLDNGISILDENLQKIVIMTDSKEEVLQMLGRKRINDKSTKKIQVFLCKRDIKFFSQRLNLLKKYDIALEHYMGRRKKYHIPFPLEDDFYVDMNKNEINENKKRLHVKILSEIWTSSDVYEQMKKFLYVNFEGILELNGLSYEQLYSRISFYEEMMEKMTEDEFAFIKEQCKWLGVSFMPEALEQYNSNKEGEYKTKVIDVLEEYIYQQGEEGRNFCELDTEEKKNLRDKIRLELKYLLELKEFDNKETICGELKKSNTCSSAERFNEIMDILQLDYFMERIAKSKFVLKKKNCDNN